MNPLLNRGENTSASKPLPVIFRFIFMFSFRTHWRQRSTYKVGETWPLTSDGTGFESCLATDWLSGPEQITSLLLRLTFPPLWKEHGRVPGCALVRIKCTCKLLDIRPFGSCSKWLRDAALMTPLSWRYRDGCGGGHLSFAWPPFAPWLGPLTYFLARPCWSCAL